MNSLTVLNFASFQVLWFSCVLGAGAYDLDWLALGAVVPLAALTWFSPTRSADITLAIVALCIGIIIDNLWVAFGILSYPDNTFAPYWIALLWVGLSLTVNHSMALFRDHTFLGSLAVGLFAPLSYLAGERFGAVTVEALWLTPWISLAWFVVFFGLSKYALFQLNSERSASVPRREEQT